MKNVKKIVHLVILAGSVISLTAVFGVEKTAQTSYEMGMAALERGEPFKATVMFQAALRKNPSYLEARVALGNAFVVLESYPEAFEQYTKALKLSSDNIESKLGIAFCNTGLGRYESALSAFEEIIHNDPSQIEAHYGMAYIYYLMNRNLWAKRKIEFVFRLNPYHFRSLLLLADIKSSEGHLDEAEDLIKRALDEKPEDPEGYTRYAMLLNALYIKNGDTGYLEDAMQQVKRALAIRPEYFHALELLGYISVNEGNYPAAIEAFSLAQSGVGKSPAILHNLGYVCERSGDLAKAVEYYEKAYEGARSDEILLARLENFLVSGEFKVGSPLRIQLGELHYKKAERREREHLDDEYLYNLRRALYLNPLMREAREKLMSYLRDEGYDNLYISELKNLQKLFPEADYGESLNVAVMNRRNRLYNLAGFSLEDPVRDVPHVLILDFISPGVYSLHPDAGEVLADTLSFTLGQFGRMSVSSVAERRRVRDSFRLKEYIPVDELLTAFADNMPVTEDGTPYRYVVYGEYTERGQAIYFNYHLLDIANGAVVFEDSVYDKGNDKIVSLALRAARKIYNAVPYWGRVLSFDERSIVINLGLYDGLKKGDSFFIIDEHDAGVVGKYSIKRKMLFTVEESDTVVSRLIPVDEQDLGNMYEDLLVYPLEKRRAKRIK